MTTFFKAVRPDGTSFHAPDFAWIEGESYGHIVEHPSFDRGDASGYLSVSTVPTDCTGHRWPARLLTVEPVDEGEVFTPDSRSLPSKRAAGRWRVTGERAAHELLGPQGEHVAALIERAGQVTGTEAEGLHAAWDAAWDAAWVAAWGAAWDAAWDAARDAARDAAGDAAGDAARDAAGDAARALVVRDLISAEHYATLTRPWREVIGKAHPDDE